MSIIKVQASTSDIHKVIAAMEEPLTGFPKNHVMLGCVALALIIHNPDISFDQVLSGVKSVCEHMSLLTDVHAPIHSSSKIN